MPQRTKEEKAAYDKQRWIDNRGNKNKEQKAAYQKQYYIDNKEEMNQQAKQRYTDNRENVIATKKQWGIDNPQEYNKRSKLKNWRKWGVKGDLSFIYDCAYITATHCWVCKTAFKNTKDRCMDHCHSSGEFRNVLCRSCNNRDSWKKY